MILCKGHELLNCCSRGLWFVCFVVLLSFLLIGLSSIIGQRARCNRDRKIAFECGFDPMRNPRMPFSLPYFLLAILFLVFDVEVVLLLGVCCRLKIVFAVLNPLRVVLCVLFCLILFLGLIHEFNEGSLEWRF